ncbi:ABC transporter substrate-binding protein [Streptomyces violascens]|uniref:Probable sugar-binding periplasmic protein n=1 Tax=Streptomyces violascens TaxID=67381 RepID=A0ABQ3R2I1_9ACTN|nr:ABC transporter substrate-binding protein [Streptomyces violascens]GGU17453.1 ABC transporter substrate-binding protein [Streptomyces violascens]GHI43747.1 ABC transporter substrate-binding protein [Streptomyces violascens]
MPRIRRTPAVALAATASIALLASACTGQSNTSASDDASKDTTITFWHGWSAPNEVKAIQADVDAFQKAHPNIHVKVVGDINDDKINQALRAGGSSAPDVVSSFTTNNVGKFCSSNAFVDLAPFLKKDGIDPAKTFPKTMNEYTQFQGKRCSLPLLGDSYALYYNKDAFKAAGITDPPKTWSQFAADAKALTKAKGDSYEQLGFMPNYHAYETTTEHYLAQWSPTYFDASGKSNIAKDPAFEKGLAFQKQLVDDLGGFAKLEKYRASFGEEYGDTNPFNTGQLAMSMDGEWRLGMAMGSKPKFEIGVAPLPVPDDQAGTYGKGYLTGTIAGIAATSKKQNAAWELVKFMTTDTDAVVDFANAIHNVPSTFDALKSPKLQADPRFKTFLDIAQNANSTTTPASVNGGQYLVSLQNLGYDVESGKRGDIKAGLARTAQEIDAAIAQAK